MFYFQSLDGSTVCTRKRLCVFWTFYAVLTVFWPFLTIGTVCHLKNSQKTVKTAKMTIGVPIVTCLPRLYQQGTNRQKQSKNKPKQQKWPLVYQS